MTQSLSPNTRRVVVIPAYNEQDTLPTLIAELKKLLTEEDTVIVVDDSADIVMRLTHERCEAAVGNRGSQVHFLTSGKRGGRGAAVRRGMEFAIQHFPSAQWFLECDADGSHRAEDIYTVLNAPVTTDVLVGSRYLPASRIIGWSITRRLQSHVLNWLIPRLLGLKLSDITNGLRRYSRDAVHHLLAHQAVSSTFIYLTEEALVLHRSGFELCEVPITFAERRAGMSSVTVDELRTSLKGLKDILLLNRQMKSPR